MTEHENEGTPSSRFDLLGVEATNSPGEADLLEAAMWLRWVGDPGSRYMMGALFAELGSVPHAEEWWLIAADDQHDLARSRLEALWRSRGEKRPLPLDWTVWLTGHMFRRTDKRLTKAARALRRAAVIHDNVSAAYLLGELLAHTNADGESEDSVTWCRRAADAGHVTATYCLTRMLDPRGTERRIALNALDRIGHADARYDLGELLEQANSDLFAAERAYRRAALSGHVHAQAALGRMLFDRQTDEKSAECERWLREASAAGVGSAIINLARLLADRCDPKAGIWILRANEFPIGGYVLSALRNGGIHSAESLDPKPPVADTNSYYVIAPLAGVRRVVKVIKSDELAVHCILYLNRYDERPTIDPSWGFVRADRQDHDDPGQMERIGYDNDEDWELETVHLPLSHQTFVACQPSQLAKCNVEAEELLWYLRWREQNGLYL